jgi:hypothetical protein
VCSRLQGDPLGMHYALSTTEYPVSTPVLPQGDPLGMHKFEFSSDGIVCADPIRRVAPELAINSTATRRPPLRGRATNVIADRHVALCLLCVRTGTSFLAC